MEFLGNGINYSTGKPITKTLDARDFIGSLMRRRDEVKSLTQATTFASTFKGGREYFLAYDINDPTIAGWTFMINSNDPQRDEIIETIRPLAELRGMANPAQPLKYNGESPEEWQNWLNQNYYMPASVENTRAPYYILMVGGPDKIPFHFQSFVDSAASVGRLDFDSISNLKDYVDKIIRLEKSEPVVSKEALLFATDGGYPDATFYSRKYMAEPLANFVEDKSGVKVNRLIGEDATKEKLAKATEGASPALVYTAGHGIGAIDEDINTQKIYNGAICCQETPGSSLKQCLFTGKDVSAFQPFFEGSVFFQFACYGYGTPAESDFAYWLDDEMYYKYKNQPFVSTLPKKMLAHPKGPVAYIGHIDVALLVGFDDPYNPDIQERWHPRMAPFIDAVRMILGGQTIGLAMANMNKRYDLGNVTLMNFFNLLRQGKVKEDDVAEKILEAYLTRSDAQNFMVLGDPAARVNLPQ